MRSSMIAMLESSPLSVQVLPYDYDSPFWPISPHICSPDITTTTTYILSTQSKSSMLKRLLNQTKSKPAEHTNPKCPKCHNSLEKPPSLEFLQRSDKAKHIKFNTTIDRSVLSCRHCAYADAKQAASEITPDKFQASRKILEDKITQANELIWSDDLQDEALKKRLEVQMPKWEDERIEIVRQEARLMNFVKLQNQMTKTVDLIGQGVFVDELKRVWEENRKVRAKFEIEWERKGWMPYWAVWGWDGEMPL